MQNIRMLNFTRLGKVEACELCKNFANIPAEDRQGKFVPDCTNSRLSFHLGYYEIRVKPKN